MNNIFYRLKNINFIIKPMNQIYSNSQIYKINIDKYIDLVEKYKDYKDYENYENYEDYENDIDDYIEFEYDKDINDDINDN
jgi:hypothetical protein